MPIILIKRHFDATEGDDAELTPVGVRRAEKYGEHLSVLFTGKAIGVVHSPQKRAVQTAEYMISGGNMGVEPVEHWTLDHNKEADPQKVCMLLQAIGRGMPPVDGLKDVDVAVLVTHLTKMENFRALMKGYGVEPVSDDENDADRYDLDGWNDARMPNVFGD